MTNKTSPVRKLPWRCSTPFNAGNARVASSDASRLRCRFRESVARSSVALHLAAVFTKDRVLYDDFHRAELNGLDMNEYLPTLYARQSELVVVFFCPEYAQKPWCSLEWRQAIEMRKDAAGKRRVMLSSFGNPGDLGSLGLRRRPICT